MTADVGVGVGIVTVGPGFVGTTNVLADSKAYTAGGAVRARCPSVPHFAPLVNVIAVLARESSVLAM